MQKHARKSCRVLGGTARAVGQLALGLGLLAGGSAQAQSATDRGSVDVLGRTFACSGSSCSSVTEESSPASYASDRDCGFSVKIGTDLYGREAYFWAFCDTPLHKRADISSPYLTLSGGLFQTNTAGLAFYNPWASSPDASTQKTLTSMSIHQDGSATSWRELIPRPVLPNCTGYAAAWPGSAVLLPNERNAKLLDRPTQDATAVVLIFFQDVCVESDLSVTRHGSGIAAWRWSSVAADDPQQQFSVPNDDPAYNLGLRATVIARELFETGSHDSSFQHGATVDDLGDAGKWLRVMRCHDKDLWNPAAQPRVGCELAQVPLSGNWLEDEPRIADINQWSYLRDPYAIGDGWRPFTNNGHGAGVSPADAYDLTRSGPLVTDIWGHPAYPDNTPNGHTSIVYHEPSATWLMMSMLWGYDDVIVVRRAAALTGPWSDGKKLTLPGQCAVGAGCYAPTFHAELNGSDTVGLSYVDADGLTVVDPITRVSKNVQQMRHATLPLSALPAAP
ncbi:MAG: hypothetical protein JWN48_573 [Myxococcaceae bacterium]|nr:hypothetical protein [Myxococcaceae bacterium]